jgi:hypothetical protein
MPFYRSFSRLTGLVGLSVLLMLLALPGRAQLSTWQPSLLVTSLGNGDSHITAVAPAPNGDLYVAGNLSGNVRLGNRNCNSTGGSDGFVARYQPATNTVVWLQAVMGLVDEQMTQLVVSGPNLYLTGQFSSGSLTAGSRIITNTNAPGGSTFDSFVLKLVDEGPQARTEWLYQLGGTENEFVPALAVAGSMVYLGGNFSSPSLRLGTATLLTNPGSVSTVPTTDGFVLALQDVGFEATLRWALPVAGPGLEAVTSLAASADTLYVGGRRSSVGGSLGSFAGLGLPYAPREQGFVGRVVNQGSSPAFPVVEELSSNGLADVSALAVSGSTVYVTGYFEGSPLTVGSDVLSPALNTDLYVARLNAAGGRLQWTWARAAAGNGYDHSHALAANEQGVYVAGQTNSATLTLGATTLSNLLPGPGTTDDLFVSYLTADGTFGATQQVGGTGNAYIGALSLTNGQLCVGGSFGGSVSFGTQAYTTPPGSYTSFAATLPTALLSSSAASALPGLALFPNPATGRAELRLPAGKGTAAFRISLLDALGRPVQRREVAAAAVGQSIELNLAGVAPGVYAVRVQQGAAQTVQKLVVK